MSQLTERQQLENELVNVLNDMANNPQGYSTELISTTLRMSARAIRGDESLFDDPEPPTHSYIVTIKGCTKEQADQVIRERLDHDEGYGFDYEVTFREVHE